MEGRILVQVPEYRDAELDATLDDIARQAERPERLRVVVLSQRSPGDPPVRMPGSVARTSEVITVPAGESRGPNWARRRLQERYDGEEYSLLIDSHLRFAPRWDTLAVAMLEGLRERAAKPVLTGYLPAYTPGRRVVPERSPYKVYPLARERGVLTKLTSYPVRGWQTLRSPVVAEYLSLHFALADASIVGEVPHDPEVYFFGDEVAYGARAFTHGWDLFHPHRVLGWHAYDRATRTPHWDDHHEWAGLHARSLDRLRRMFTGDPALGGLIGGARTIGDYERHIMVPLVVPAAPGRGPA